MASGADTSGIEVMLKVQGMDDDLTRDLVALHKPAVVFDSDPFQPRDDVAVGASKLLGVPDLGPEQSWPIRPAYTNLDEKLARYDGYADSQGFRQTQDYLKPFERARIERHSARLAAPAPLDFVAQFDLAECWAAQSGLDPDIPRSGLLSLFYDTQEQPWGFDPADHVGFQVLYTDADADQLTPATLPAALTMWRNAEQDAADAMYAAGLAAQDAARKNQGFFSKLMGEDPLQDVWLPEPQALPDMSLAVELTAKSAATMPDLMWQLKDLAPELQARVEATEYGYSALGDIEWQEQATQIGGWPASVQDPNMGLEAQLVSNGIYLGNADGYNSPEAQPLKEGAADWMMLAQIGSDEGAGMWGDGGMLFIWIRRQDLRARNFNAAWLFLQSY